MEPIQFVKSVPRSKEDGLLPYAEIVEALLEAADTPTPWAEFEAATESDAAKMVRTFKMRPEGVEVRTRKSPLGKRMVYVRIPAPLTPLPKMPQKSLGS